VGEAITRVALALAETKKIDENIQKTAKSDDPTERAQMDALVTRANYLRKQLEVCEAQITERGGKAAEKLAELKMNRDRAFTQLSRIFESNRNLLNQHNLDLVTLLPSIADFIAVEPRGN